jgi:hypothetical protein
MEKSCIIKYSMQFLGIFTGTPTLIRHLQNARDAQKNIRLSLSVLSGFAPVLKGNPMAQTGLCFKNYPSAKNQ